MQITAMAYMAAVGLESCSGSILGQLIGAGEVSMARAYYKTIISITRVNLMFNVLILYFG